MQEVSSAFFPEQIMATRKKSPAASPPKYQQTSLKLDPAMLDKADEAAEALSQPGLKVARADALRVAINRGLALILEEKKAASGR